MKRFHGFVINWRIELEGIEVNVMSEPKKLNVDMKVFNEFGISNVQVDLLLRESKQSHLSFENKGKIEFPKEFQEMIPFGNPPKFMAAYATKSNEGYMSVFYTDDTAIHLSSKTELANLKNSPIKLIRPLKHAMEKTLQNSSETLTEIQLNLSAEEIKMRLELIKQLDNFDAIIYKILTRGKVLILGNLKDTLPLLETIYMVIPEKYRNQYGFSINLPVIKHDSISFYLLDSSMDKEAEEKIPPLFEMKVDLIDTNKKMCYGDFTCEYTQKINQLLGEEDGLNKAYELIQEIIEHSNSISNDESSTDYANRVGIRYDNADLIEAMKKRDLPN